MALLMSLAATFGKPVAERLIAALTSREGGAEKLKKASAALAGGATAIAALKEAFGKDFLGALNDALGASSTSMFGYEAGTQSYIRVEDSHATPSKLLRDELNINLDRLTALKVDGQALKNHFQGLMAVWKQRCRQHFDHTTCKEDLDTTFTTIDQLLKGEIKNMKQMLRVLTKTGLGTGGALMVIGGAIIATGTGAGLGTTISLFLFGVPWATVGLLVVPGALMLLLAAQKLRPVDEMSLSIALAYKLMDRIDQQRA